MGELVVSAPEASARSSVYASAGQDVESVIVGSPVPFMPVHTGFSWVQEGLAIAGVLDQLRELSRQACEVAAAQGLSADSIVSQIVGADDASGAVFANLEPSVEAVVVR